MKLDLAGAGRRKHPLSGGGFMNVLALMNPNVKYGGTDCTVADVIAIMEKEECGAIPIINPQNKVVGIVTDRDICLALGKRPLPAAGISVTEVMSKRVFACGPDEDIADALQTMRDKKVRRLPVIDEKGRLVGILSMDDVVLHAEARKTDRIPRKLGLGYGQTVDTLKAIYKRPGDGKELISHP
jgi:CBS domain-containing protein